MTYGGNNRVRLHIIRHLVPRRLIWRCPPQLPIVSSLLRGIRQLLLCLRQLIQQLSPRGRLRAGSEPTDLDDGPVDGRADFPRIGFEIRQAAQLVEIRPTKIGLDTKPLVIRIKRLFHRYSRL